MEVQEGSLARVEVPEDLLEVEEAGPHLVMEVQEGSLVEMEGPEDSLE